MTKKKSKASKASPTSKESKYLDSIDFRSWWESFRFDTLKNGQQKYKTVWSFICNKTKVNWQRDLLYWVLGPKVEGNPASPYSKFEQLDWETRLDKGVWYKSENLENLSKQIKMQGHAMAKIGELGNINIDFIARLKMLLTEIDKEFGGSLHLPNLSRKANRERAEHFFWLQRQIFDLLKDAQILYGKMQGIDLAQLTQFIAMFGKGMGQVAGMGQMLGIQTGEPEKEKHHGTFNQILDMMVTKSAKHELPLPDEDMNKIIIDQKPKLVKGRPN